MLSPSPLKDLLSLYSGKLSSYLYSNLLRTNLSFTVIDASLQDILFRIALYCPRLKLVFKKLLFKWI